jgi:myo-inositol-1(or 4)-monophosphatase
MVDWLRFFQSVSKEVYNEVNQMFGSDQAIKIVGRGAGGDMTRYIDRRAEEIVLKFLEKKKISCILVSEECGIKIIGENPQDYVVLDGIDGTTNAARGIPFTSISIAHATEPYLHAVDVGLVMDLSKGITFSAKTGRGAYEEGHLLEPSSITSLMDGVFSVKIPVNMKRKEILHGMTRLIPLISNMRKLRQLGSVALEMCYVAAGRLDACVDLRHKIRATDFAAAYLIVREAGGIILNPDGNEVMMELKATSKTPFIAAANLILCQKILNQLQIKSKN